MGYDTMCTRYEQFNSNRSDVIKQVSDGVWPLLHYPDNYAPQKFIHAPIKTCPDYSIFD